MNQVECSTGRDKNRQKEAPVCDMTTRLFQVSEVQILVRANALIAQLVEQWNHVARKCAQPNKGSRFTNQGSKDYELEGCKGQERKANLEAIGGENDQRQVTFLPFSIGTFLASCLGEHFLFLEGVYQ